MNDPMCEHDDQETVDRLDQEEMDYEWYSREDDDDEDDDFYISTSNVYSKTAPTKPVTLHCQATFQPTHLCKNS
jgi:hypothetical protein